MSLLRCCFLAPLLLGSLAAAPAPAATLNVPSTTYPTIQSGINAAQPGDTVLVADGTYTGPGNVDLDFGGKNITVQSVHGASATTIDCQGSSSSPHRGFYLHSGETSAATISGFTITGGYADNSGADSNGGGVYAGSGVTVTNCTISGCTAEGGDGGGIYAQHTAVITGCTVSGCTTTISFGGGGVWAGSGSAVTDCTIMGNTLSGTGGGYAGGFGGGGI